MKRIGIVAGEKSGDYLGSELIKSIKLRYPDAEFVGLAGPLMQEQGAVSLAEMDKISIMGIAGALKSLFVILGIRRKIHKHMLAWQPDVFIGIDVPDFNLSLEIKLKQAGIPIVLYVSPTNWAGRGQRIHKIKKSVDLMLTLFPFEAKFYQQYSVPVCFVGHNLADSIPFNSETATAREQFNFKADDQIVCLMPGSRGSEVDKLAPVFIQTAELIHSHNPNVQFILPAANDARKQQIEQFINNLSPGVDINLIDGNSKACMQTADVILLASGTATLEGMLLKKPMIVSYIVAPLTAMIMKRLLKQDFISLPNLLAGREVVPELLQENATAKNLADAVNERLENENLIQELQQTFLSIHKQLKCNANDQAALAIVNLLESNTYDMAESASAAKTPLDNQ